MKAQYIADYTRGLTLADIEGVRIGAKGKFLYTKRHLEEVLKVLKKFTNCKPNGPQPKLGDKRVLVIVEAEVEYKVKLRTKTYAEMPMFYLY